MKPSYIHLDTCPSTNSELAARAASLPDGTVVVCRCQSAGRGQRGNTWESEPGSNLTFSILLRPHAIGAARQFELSMIISLAIVRAVDNILSRNGSGARCSIKWPNDIYVGDRKLCGILIENVLSGNSISRSIAGIGINVNQRRFMSDAPNPVSIVQLTGRESDLGEALAEVAGNIVDDLGTYEADPCPGNLATEYRRRLWRADGRPYPFIDTASGMRFDATLVDVAVDGVITLRPADSSPDRRYFFKEVAFVL